MHTYVEYLNCGDVEALGYFQLSYLRYDVGIWSPKELEQQSSNFT